MDNKPIKIPTKTKSLLSGNTPHAQGGIIFKGLNDSPRKLKSDIFKAGAGSCWELRVLKQQLFSKPYRF